MEPARKKLRRSIMIQGNRSQSNKTSKKSPKFFENYAKQEYGFKTLVASSCFSEIKDALNYLKSRNYFKDHFKTVCTSVKDKTSKKTPKNRWACECQKSLQTPPRKFMKKMSINTRTVISAVDSMLNDVFTRCPELLGSERNGLQFRRNVCHVLGFTKNQSVANTLLTRKLKMKAVAWVTQFTDIPYRTRLFSEFCLGLFHMIQIVLLRHFYIAVNRVSQPVFYLKTHWHGLVQLHENLLKSEKLELAVIPTKGARKIRWTPKGLSCLLRPICLHRTEKDEKQNFESLNFVLKTILSHPELSGTRTTTRPSKDLRLKWKHFHREWVEAGSPKMFVVQSDLKDAFGCIEHQKLLDIVTKWLDKIFSSYPKLTLYRSYNRKKRTSSYWFQEIPGQTCPSPQSDYCTPKVVKTYTQKSLVYWVQRYIRQLFTSQVKIGKHIFEYATGILQGHPLSSNLCELYYGDIFNSYHSDFKSETSEPTLVLNAMDDMILITADKHMALRYLNFIRDKSECPVPINMSKLSSNLCPLGDACKAGPTGPHTKKLFSFCGVNIHSENLNLSGSYVNYENKNMFHSFTFKPDQSHIRVIKNKLSFFLSLKAHALFFDRECNSLLTIVRNIFELGVHQACRFNSLAINLCIQNYDSELKQILVTSLIDLSEHVARRLRWKSDGTKQTRILFILVEAMMYISLKYNAHFGLNRPDLMQILVSLRPTLEDRDLIRWIESLKKKSLVPKLLMGGV
uniref:Telomerase reverse transcriptase n=1 Tax=Cacopsylla melanoneura TaxID=428564 RepID=A0A8D8TJ97_9HEMI